MGQGFSVNHNTRFLAVASLALTSAHGLGQGAMGGNRNDTGPRGQPPKVENVATAAPVIKAGEQVTLKGKLKGGLVAIGGETTGWQLAYAKDKGAATLEVDMQAIKDAESLDGAEVTITGSIFSKQYVERGAVLILKAATVVASATKKSP